MRKPPLTFNRKKKYYNPVKKKDALKIPSFGCIVEHFVLVFILISGIWQPRFSRFTLWTFIFNVNKTKHYLGTENFAKLGFAIHDPTHKYLFQKS